tara:strand:- start:390 stop:992 length:603 start_codon:yes stop_codon:yes gene_type:complete
MNLKEELQKMNIRDLRFVCKDLGISCPTSKSSIIKRLLNPLSKKYKMGSFQVAVNQGETATVCGLITCIGIFVLETRFNENTGEERIVKIIAGHFVTPAMTNQENNSLNDSGIQFLETIKNKMRENNITFNENVRLECWLNNSSEKIALKYGSKTVAWDLLKARLNIVCNNISQYLEIPQSNSTYQIRKTNGSNKVSMTI